MGEDFEEGLGCPCFAIFCVFFFCDLVSSFVFVFSPFCGVPVDSPLLHLECPTLVFGFSREPVCGGWSPTFFGSNPPPPNPWFFAFHVLAFAYFVLWLGGVGLAITFCLVFLPPSGAAFFF